MHKTNFFALANGGDGKPPNWHDFVGIVVLLVINPTVSFIDEKNAGNTAAALMVGLAPKAKEFTDGCWSELEASILVPGDIISIKFGDIVPADAHLLQGTPLKVDQFALTGEFLAVMKNPGDLVYCGSICMGGETEAVVYATGIHMFSAKAAHLLGSTNQLGHFQKVTTNKVGHFGHFLKVLVAIGNFCLRFIAIGMIIEIVIMYTIQKRKFRNGIHNLLVLIIGGIPIAIPLFCQ